MTNTKICLLVVDDDPDGWVHETIRRSLKRQSVDVISAYDQDAARSFLKKHGSRISMIVMDACVPGNRPNTAVLIQDIRKWFSGPIIGSSAGYLEYLHEAGCSFVCSKENLPQVLQEEVAKIRQAQSAP